MNKILALIPARGGSKRILEKNIINFRGKPLISYAIQTALEASIFDEIYVSTDSEKIGEIALQNGATEILARPESISNDEATIFDVVNYHAKKNHYFKECEFLCLIYATSPLLLAEDLTSAFNNLCENKLNSVVSCQTFSFPPLRSFHLNRDNHSIEYFFPEFKDTRSQDLPHLFHDSGDFLWVRFQEFLKQKKLLPKPNHPFMLPKYRGIDIDNEEDLEFANFLYEFNKK